jgi:GTP pyrophosphokinase
MTAKLGGPSLGWLDPHLGYIKTAHARNKIRSWFKQQDHEKHFRAGRAILERERHKLGLKEADQDDLARHFHLARPDDLLLAIGRGDVSPTQVAAALRVPDSLPRHPASARRPVVHKPTGAVTVQGIRNLMTHFAHCCTPSPGDPIVGYVTVGRGVAIHRQDCANILGLPEWRMPRLIEVSWESETEVFPVDLEVRAVDRQGLLKDVSQVLAHEHINIVRTDTLTNALDQSVMMRITIEIADFGQLSVALDKLGEIPNVLGARRMERFD